MSRSQRSHSCFPFFGVTCCDNQGMSLLRAPTPSQGCISLKRVAFLNSLWNSMLKRSANASEVRLALGGGVKLLFAASAATRYEFAETRADPEPCGRKQGPFVESVVCWREPLYSHNRNKKLWSIFNLYSPFRCFKSPSEPFESCTCSSWIICLPIPILSKQVFFHRKAPVLGTCTTPNQNMPLCKKHFKVKKNNLVLYNSMYRFLSSFVRQSSIVNI